VLRLLALPIFLVLCAAACGRSSNHGLKTNKSPQTSVTVDLVDYQVKPSTASVSRGPTRFTATNQSNDMTHELAVLRVKSDGSLENEGEIEDLSPGASGSITLDLPAGRYQLACLIAPGEFGSTVDHYKQGMHVDFSVTS
jgi:iron uptake system component EfeO